MTIEDAVGKWCLIRAKADWFGKPKEALIAKLSPSGRYMKYRFQNSEFVWANINDIEILEILE